MPTPVQIEPDALVEAEILVEQGLLEPAIQMLQAQLDLAPERTDIEDWLRALRAITAAPVVTQYSPQPQMHGGLMLAILGGIITLLAGIYLVLQ